MGIAIKLGMNLSISSLILPLAGHGATRQHLLKCLGTIEAFTCKQFVVNALKCSKIIKCFASKEPKREGGSLALTVKNIIIIL